LSPLAGCATIPAPSLSNPCHIHPERPARVIVARTGIRLCGECAKETAEFGLAAGDPHPFADNPAAEAAAAWAQAEAWSVRFS
jgi:hypothetical protein